MKISLLILFISSLSACSHFLPQKVEPWERGIMARQNMSLSPDPVQTGLDEHIYFSKEAATGGNGVGGGGCGCN